MTPGFKKKTGYAALFWLCLSAAVLVSRLCHSNILWADEDYHLAAAIQVLHGKIPYRDFWYDKPPLNLAFYLLFGARTGMLLRVADALFVCLCCVLAWRFASRLWSRREGFFAAGALAFFLIFYLPPGVLPLEPDTLMLAPHLAAVYLAWRRKPFWAGLAAGIAFQLNVKGVFVVAAAALFLGTAGLPALLLGFLIPAIAVLGWLVAVGAAGAYYDQVWQWGLLYAGKPAPNAPAGLLSVLDWMGFHAALIVAAAWYWFHDRTPERARFLGWCVLAVAAAAVGGGFAPRYFMPLLAALLIPAARGFATLRPAVWAVAVIALAVPAVRFGPRYAVLAREDLAGVPHAWKDVAMDRESRRAARIVEAAARPGDTIFIWGYRPDIVAYTRLPVAGRFWDSQPVTGVPADRHLTDSRPVDAGLARRNRQELIRTRPSFLVDGLSSYNPGLDIHRYPDLASWLAHYCVLGQAGATTVYRLCGRKDQ
jgi:hypothetical protein